MKIGKIVIFKLRDRLLNNKKANKKFFLCLIFFLPFFLFSKKKEEKVVYMEHADSTVFNKRCDPNIYVMRGSVVFRHGDTYLYCDKALFNKKKNSMEAFQNIRIEQGDTFFISGDHLVYEGNKNLVKMNGRVCMRNKGMTLYTNFLYYDRNLNLGYFLGGGTLKDSINELTSFSGQYSLKTGIVNFSRNVILTNPQFVLHSDTLKYSVADGTAAISGISIIESNKVIVYSSKGWYNTITGKSIFYNHSVLVEKNESKTLTADTILYNHKTGLGEAIGHIELNDTVRKIVLNGNHGYYNFYTNIVSIIDSAQFIFYSQSDTFFLHADTLQMKKIDNINELKAFYGVCMYSTNFQFVADSLQFNTFDYTCYIYGNPVLWHENYQITGEKMTVFCHDRVIKQMDVHNHVFIMEKKDTTHFNQIEGKNSTSFFDKRGELKKITVEGNTESIYFIDKENKMGFFGMNKTVSPCMTIYFSNRNPIKIEYYPAPKSELILISNLTFEQKFLKGFVDYFYLRPKIKKDIFLSRF